MKRSHYRFYKIEYFLVYTSITLLLFTCKLYSNIIYFDISDGYKDSTFTVSDVGYNSKNGVDTIQFSNGFSICTYYTPCNAAMFLCGSGGLFFINQQATIFKAKDTNDVVWNRSLIVPPADTIISPIYILYNVIGDEMPEVLPHFEEIPITSKRIVYCRFNNRNFKFQLDSVMLDTNRIRYGTIEIRYMVIKFSSDSLGNGKFQHSNSPILEDNNVMKKNEFELFNNKQLLNSNLFIKTSGAFYINLIGRKIDLISDKNQLRRRGAIHSARKPPQ